MAIKLGGRGDITQSHLLWRYDKSLPDVPGILLYRDVLYLVRNGGIVQTLDPGTGKLLKQARLMHALDEYYASPVAGDGKVIFVSNDGTLTVMRAGGEYEVLSTARFEQTVFATPAVADGKVYIRTAGSLFCFGHKKE